MAIRIIIVLILLPMLACVSNNNFDELMKNYYELNRKGNYTEAAVVAELAVLAADKTPDSVINVIVALDSVGIAYEKSGQLQKAEQAYKRSLLFAEKAYGPDHYGLKLPLGALEQICTKQGKHAEAEQFANRAKGIRLRANGSIN